MSCHGTLQRQKTEIEQRRSSLDFSVFLKPVCGLNRVSQMTGKLARMEPIQILELL